MDPACKACGYFPLCRGGCRRYRPAGEEGSLGRNCLCEGYRKFFGHALPRLAGVGGNGGGEVRNPFLAAGNDTDKIKPGAMSKHNAWQDSLDKGLPCHALCFQLGVAVNKSEIRIACAVFRQWHGLFSLSAYCALSLSPASAYGGPQRKNIPYAATWPRRGWFLKGKNPTV